MTWPIYFILLSCAAASEITAEQYAKFPPHFHLDNYQRCLSQKNGLYCLGTFELTPTKEPHTTFQLMKEYSKNPFKFNRTLIRRGYCVSSRCPIFERKTTLMQNMTMRFEQCAAKWGEKQALRPTLRKLHYCRTYEDVKVKKPLTPEQTLFINIIYTLLVFNMVGTVYDLLGDEKTNKNRLLMAWSIRANWKRLTATRDGDPLLNDLQPIQGVKVLCTLIVMYAHTNVAHHFFYTSSQEYLEQIWFRKDGILLSHGSILVHAYVMITTFLTAYNFLLYAEKKPVGLHMLPMYIIKRLVRITPVSILVVGFAATWWPYIARDGPLISYSIGVESQICKEKFWYHLFYINNIVDRSRVCLVPTWFLAVDMHIYTLVCILILIMWKNHQRAIRLYTALIFISCLMHTVLTYLNGWKSLIHLTKPEILRVLFRSEDSFASYYMSSWGTLPSCFTGLMMAHLHYVLQKRNIDLGKNKLFVFWHWICIVVGVAWVIETGKVARQYSSSPLIISAILGVVQLVFTVIIGSFLFGLFNIKGYLSRLFAWSGLHAMGRMSLAVMLTHWIVNVVIAARPIVFHTSFFDTGIDWIATVVITYTISIPVTILVEIPVQKFLGALIG